MKYSKRYFDLEKLVVFVLCAFAVTALGAALFGCDSGDVTTITEVVECVVPPPHCEQDCPDCTDDEVEELLALYYPVAPSEGFVSQ